MSNQTVAIGGTGITDHTCEHPKDLLGVEFLKSVHEDKENPDNTTFLVKQYCRCGARLYGTTKLNLGDEIDKQGEYSYVIKRAKI